MLLGLDHLVIAVRDLDAAAKDYTALGFTVVPGGRHTGIGTENQLIAFQDGSYLELIGFYEQPRADHRWWAPLERGGGLVDYCLQTDDLAGDTRALRAAGVDIGDPEPKGRQRPDGVEVRWVFSLARGADRGVAPFIIADETGRDERVPRQRSHANGVTGVGAVTIAVEDVARVRRWLAGVPGRPAADVKRPELEAAGLSVEIGPQRIDFLAPAGQRGPIAAWLAQRGPSPYAATLCGRARRGPLDPATTHAARLAIE